MPTMTAPPAAGYADRIPYDRPTSLDDLRGPNQGTVRVAPNIDTGLHPVYDLSDPNRVRSLYAAVLRDSSVTQQEVLLNRNTLVAVWSSLDLPDRCRRLWEDSFPQLKSG
jgi:hypothetical protein